MYIGTQYCKFLFSNDLSMEKYSIYIYIKNNKKKSQNRHKTFWLNWKNQKISKLFLCFSLERVYRTNLEIKIFPGNKNSISFSNLVKASKLVGFNLWSAGHGGGGGMDYFWRVCVRELIKTGPLLANWNSLYQCLFLSCKTLRGLQIETIVVFSLPRQQFLTICFYTHL